MQNSTTVKFISINPGRLLLLVSSMLLARPRPRKSVTTKQLLQRRLPRMQRQLVS